MPKQKFEDGGPPDSKHKKNFSSSGEEVRQQEVNSKGAVIFSSVSSGYKQKQTKKDALDAITHSVNAVSGEGR